LATRDQQWADVQEDETHSSAALSWVSSANTADTDFPIQNLPFGVFQKDGTARIGIGIGDQILDLRWAYQKGMLSSLGGLAPLCAEATLKPLMEKGRAAARQVRRLAFQLLHAGSAQQERVRAGLVSMQEAEMMLPVEIGDFTDFYTSVHHARRGGKIARPSSPELFPNFKNLPIAYHGRASTVVPSGTLCRRPWGQFLTGSNDLSHMAPTQKLDFELEVGCYVGPGNHHGQPIALVDTPQHIFGVCLVNDWSARDIQRWESQPLGPFLSKSFMTSVSPWVVTLDALQPFQVPPADRGDDAPRLSPYLDSPEHRLKGGLDITLQVLLRTSRMREDGRDAAVVTETRYANQFWTSFQMLAHHSSNGCNLRTGDLLSSGTVSDSEQSRAGCLFELTWDGTTPIPLPNGEQLTYLSDGDEVVFRGRCSRDGYRSIGFGTCSGLVIPALSQYPGARA